MGGRGLLMSEVTLYPLTLTLLHGFLQGYLAHKKQPTRRTLQ